jgi:hypothetical protein
MLRQVAVFLVGFLLVQERGQYYAPEEQLVLLVKLHEVQTCEKLVGENWQVVVKVGLIV